MTILISVAIILFLFLVVLEFELGAYTLSHATSPFFLMGFQYRISRTIFPGLAWNGDSPDLCLLNS
jgi:hypothetical protein